MADKTLAAFRRMLGDLVDEAIRANVPREQIAISLELAARLVRSFSPGD